jgi:hypothetical protein
VRRFLHRLGARTDQHTAELRAELVLLRDENMRLRLERQRLLGAAASAERVRELVGAVTSTADEADDAWQALADAQALRTALLRVVSEMQHALRTAHEQLTAGTPPTELDRRVGGRRRDDALAVSKAEQAPDAGDRPAVRHLRQVGEAGRAERRSRSTR